jgi:uncharacterized protein YjbJ (UPF0337 family)
MDDDRIKGSATDIGGKVKDAAGNLLGDNKMQAEGKADQASGQLQNAYGSVKDTVREGADTLGTQVDSLLKERPMVALLGAVGVGYVLARLMRR